MELEKIDFLYFPFEEHCKYKYDVNTGPRSRYNWIAWRWNIESEPGVESIETPLFVRFSKKAIKFYSILPVSFNYFFQRLNIVLRESGCTGGFAKYESIFEVKIVDLELPQDIVEILGRCFIFINEVLSYAKFRKRTA